MVNAVRTRRLTLSEFETLSERALAAAGANSETVAALVRATVAAEHRSKPEVGAAHLVDYLNALRAGRMNGDASPRIDDSRAGVIVADADDGVAQLAFEKSIELLSERAGTLGVATLSINNAFSGGEMGYYAARAAERGFVAIACGNSAALMSAHGSRSAVTGTNPFAFALPHPRGPRLFDQASSATAWVKVRDAALSETELPEGWALDRSGEPTVEAQAALSGALLPFGGAKGSNIALMVEMLATLSGGSFSLNAAPFDSGTEPPRLGVWVLVLDPRAFDPHYEDRAEAHLTELASVHGVDFGRRKPAREFVEITEAVYQSITNITRKAS